MTYNRISTIVLIIQSVVSMIVVWIFRKHGWVGPLMVLLTLLAFNAIRVFILEPNFKKR